MEEKQMEGWIVGASQRSPQSASLLSHERPPNGRRPYERPQTEFYAAEPCQFLAGSSTEFGGTHMGATADFFSGTHLGSFADFFSGTHFGSTSGEFGGTHLGSTSGEFGGTHLGSTSGEYGGTHKTYGVITLSD